MRSSTRQNDPGYKNFVPGKYQIFLDGKPAERCITADEEEGFVTVYVLDSSGNHIWNENRDGLVTKTLKGKVEIKLRHVS